MFQCDMDERWHVSVLKMDGDMRRTESRKPGHRAHIEIGALEV